MKKQFPIAGRMVGLGNPCFIIAEVGVNHNGNIDLACQLVDAAVMAGADAVKFQTYQADKLASATARKAAYQRSAEQDRAEESQLDMLQRLTLSRDAHYELQVYCQKRGILFLSSPFDMDSADFLAEMKVAAFKIPSGELTNHQFLHHIAKKNRPIIISTGMADLEETRAALSIIAEAGNDEVIALQCISNYPADPRNVNLRAMQTIAKHCDVAAGYSDHTLGVEVSLAAVALGACVIEKHITLDNGLPGPDHQASSEPEEFQQMVRGIRIVESALGDGRKIPATSEVEVADIARKSLIAACDIISGAVLKNEMLDAMRPGTGISPAYLPIVLGRRVRNRIASGTILTWEMLE